MEIKCESGPLESFTTEVLVVGVYRDGCSAPADLIDRANNGLITRLLKSGELTADPGKTLTLYDCNGTKAPITIVTGLGSQADFGPGAAFRAMGAALRSATDRPRHTITLACDADWSRPIAEAAVAGAMVGCQGPGMYQEKPNRSEPDELAWLGISSEACDSGQVIGSALQLTRRLINEPPSFIYPETFADQAREIAAATGMAAEVWDETRLDHERCGALLAVARGSVRPPRLVILRHRGGGSDDPWLALVGKGVTFDSGGLSLKTSAGMLTMKCDMAGAATVLGALDAIARLQLPINVMGLMGLVENMPGANAFKLGDVLTTRTGKTIEVHNTDAEGRLVLADALSVAVDQGANKLIDLATLTGACVVALGNDVAGLMTNQQDWCDTIQQAADQCGERVWQLPMFPEYRDQIKSSVADIRNVGEGRFGGAITAAKLLEEFVGDIPWTHIDIAGPAFRDKPQAWSDAGATGVMVRTLVQVARDWDAS